MNIEWILDVFDVCITGPHRARPGPLSPSLRPVAGLPSTVGSASDIRCVAVESSWSAPLSACTRCAATSRHASSSCLGFQRAQIRKSWKRYFLIQYSDMICVIYRIVIYVLHLISNIYYTLCMNRLLKLALTVATCIYLSSIPYQIMISLTGAGIMHELGYVYSIWST